MPELSRFFGIVVMMFYNDHPPPHFHVRYSGQKAIIAIESLAILEGRLLATCAWPGDGMGGVTPAGTPRGLEPRRASCSTEVNCTVGVAPCCTTSSKPAPWVTTGYL